MLHIPVWLEHAINTYGYLAILVAVALEGMGVPFPGETALIAGAVYAGTGRPFNIVGVIVAAAIGAILGDTAGYAIGRFGGYQLLRRFGPLIHLDERALAPVRRFFARHGGKTIFIGRYLSILRTYVSFFAGLNRMPWPVFAVWNAAAVVIWATIYGWLGYTLGNNIGVLDQASRVLGIGGVVVIIAGIVGAIVFVSWQARRAVLRDGDADEATNGTNGADALAGMAQDEVEAE
jgi:membrane protein DedA with SNARE-associated domain